ncbi:enoyl-CoA hydratase-related protein [Zavarzinia compransoris]|uniref:Enoyl-CoA hydratase n=1 Tax=Zavarzinia compransoris TaxID=1264899 RepID=A0A317E4L7_9PROT|nr:enoyl-CoA hydratase-related protein [Zavarzinia compransoris]PWR21997.1 enoyl-CoA hydratase [Zavarzinia compransoris]TDP47264.1 short chain enoyl-CoA hydratase [Zavarzinia compransoris]
MILISTRPEDGVVLLQLNRPAARNALDLELRRALAAAFDALADDPAARAVVVTGNDEAFAAGADIAMLATRSPREVEALGLHRLWRSIAEFPKPVIAAVNGFALGGGCELAMHADLIVAGEGAKFGQPELKVGIIPGAGGTQRLVRLIGRTRTMRLLLSGEMISGREAFDWGLASHLAADEEVLATALRLAARIAALPAGACALVKELVLQAADLPLDAALALERKSFWLSFDTPDQREGMAAFLEKRRPRFNGTDPA